MRYLYSSLVILGCISGYLFSLNLYLLGFAFVLFSALMVYLLEHRVEKEIWEKVIEIAGGEDTCQMNYSSKPKTPSTGRTADTKGNC